MDLLSNYQNIDKKEALKLVGFSGLLLKELSDDFKNDEGIVKLAVTTSWSAIQYASKRLQADLDILSIAVTKNADSLKYVGNEIKNNDPLMKNLTILNYKCLTYGSIALKNDRNLILPILTKYGSLLASVGDAIKQDKISVMTAIKNSYHAFCHASSYLKKDKEVILTAISADKYAYSLIAPEIQRTAWCQYAYAHFRHINKEDMPLVIQALIDNETLFLNPPPILKAMTDSMDYPYLILAAHALSSHIHTIENAIEWPNLEL